MYKSLPSGSGGVAYDFPMIVLSEQFSPTSDGKKVELFLHVEELPESSHNFYSSSSVLLVKLQCT